MSLHEKIWESEEIQDEIVCFSTDGEGAPIGGDLVYAPQRMRRLCSWDGKTDYEQDRDFTIAGRQILRTEGSRIPLLPRGAYCKPYLGQPEKAWLRLPGGKEYFEIFPEIYRWQCRVSYRPAERWDGFIPTDESRRLPRTMAMLSGGTDFHLVFYGDSITAGWEASGCNEYAVNLDCAEFHLTLNRPPYQPAWAQAVTEALAKAYPHTRIHKFNRSAGAATTGWGAENAARLVGPCAPDLVVLAFGMNSLQDEPLRFQAEIKTILSRIRAEKPECEFLLVSPMTPSGEIAGLQNNQLARQEAALAALCAEEPGIALAPVNAVFREVGRRGKTHIDLTGNCINHPNDFAVRIYAQTVLSALGL